MALYLSIPFFAVLACCIVIDYCDNFLPMVGLNFCYLIQLVILIYATVKIKNTIMQYEKRKMLAKNEGKMKFHLAVFAFQAFTIASETVEIFLLKEEDGV